MRARRHINMHDRNIVHILSILRFMRYISQLDYAKFHLQLDQNFALPPLTTDAIHSVQLESFCEYAYRYANSVETSGAWDRVLRQIDETSRTKNKNFLKKTLKFEFWKI